MAPSHPASPSPIPLPILSSREPSLYQKCCQWWWEFPTWQCFKLLSHSLFQEQPWELPSPLYSPMAIIASVGPSSYLSGQVEYQQSQTRGCSEPQLEWMDWPRRRTHRLKGSPKEDRAKKFSKGRKICCSRKKSTIVQNGAPILHEYCSRDGIHCTVLVAHELHILFYKIILVARRGSTPRVGRLHTGAMKQTKCDHFLFVQWNKLSSFLVVVVHEPPLDSTLDFITLIRVLSNRRNVSE